MAWRWEGLANCRDCAVRHVVATVTFQSRTNSTVQPQCRTVLLQPSPWLMRDFFKKKKNLLPTELSLDPLFNHSLYWPKKYDPVAALRGDSAARVVSLIETEIHPLQAICAHPTAPHQSPSGSSQDPRRVYESWNTRSPSW